MSHIGVFKWSNVKGKKLLLFSPWTVSGMLISVEICVTSTDIVSPSDSFFLGLVFYPFMWRIRLRGGLLNHFRGGSSQKYVHISNEISCTNNG